MLKSNTTRTLAHPVRNASRSLPQGGLATITVSASYKSFQAYLLAKGAQADVSVVSNNVDADTLDTSPTKGSTRKLRTPQPLPAARKRKRKAEPQKKNIFEVERLALMESCRVIDTPRALAIWIIAKHDAWDQYLSLPRPDDHSDTFADDYLLTEMLSKHPDLPNVSIDKEAAAKTAWFEAEARCARYNELLGAVNDGIACLLPSLDRLLNRVRTNVRKILGPLNRRALEEIESRMRFGPGASSSCRGREVLPSRKEVASWDATPKLYPFVRSLIPRIGGEPVSHDIAICTANAVTLVPKNSKTLRAIAIEAHANIYAQLGVGSYMRKQLKHATGIDLDFQADVNRSRLLSENIATIDLSSASDSISRRLVEYLLDDRWCHLLDILRAEYSSLDDREIRLEKFSSMGNGFTFELESIIFYAVAEAAGALNISVFGDDIIVEQDKGTDVIRALEYLGFKVNQKKTYVAGVFYESCGVDVWRGSNIRPFYLKGKYESFEIGLVRILNKIRLYASRRNRGHGCCSRFRRVWSSVYRLATKARSTGVPYGTSDTGIIRNWDEFVPSIAKRGWDGWIARHFTVKALPSAYTSNFGRYASSLRGGYPAPYRTLPEFIENEPRDTPNFAASGGVFGSDLAEPMRGSVDRAALRQVRNLFVRNWSDIGPWV